MVGSTLSALGGPCDIYLAGGTPCVAAHSVVRALYSAYNGPLYQVTRSTDNTTKDIGIVAWLAIGARRERFLESGGYMFTLSLSATTHIDQHCTAVLQAGGFAAAASQDAFCTGATCRITKIYDQSPKGNDLSTAPPGGAARHPDIGMRQQRISGACTFVSIERGAGSNNLHDSVLICYAYKKISQKKMPHANFCAAY